MATVHIAVMFSINNLGSRFWHTLLQQWLHVMQVAYLLGIKRQAEKDGFIKWSSPPLER
jgi:hypothetical protein